MLTPTQIQAIQSTNTNPGGTTTGGFNAPQNQPMNDQQFQQWAGTSAPSNPVSQGQTSASQPKDTFMGGTLTPAGEQFKGDLQQTGSDIMSKIQGTGENAGQGAIQRGTGIVSDIASVPFKGLAAIIDNTLGSINGKPIGTTLLNAPGKAINEIGNDIGNFKPLQDWVQAHPVAASALSQIAGTASNVGNISGAVLGAAGGVEGATKIAPTLAEGITKGAKAIADTGTSAVNAVTGNLLSKEPKPIAPLNESSVVSNYNRAIKPSVTGKSTASQIASSNKNVVSGLQSIVDNKPNLKLTDDTGATVSGSTPQTPMQLSQAIEQTKGQIFQKYNAMATQAGEQGISVNPRSVATELDPVIQSKSLAISNPDAVTYARDLQSRLWQQGKSLDPNSAQEVIKTFNDELKSFYKNPTPGAASKVQIDALVANKFRTSLDTAITSIKGEGYQTLKNQYGALSSMEKDVAKRADIEARKNHVGLTSNIGTMMSGLELVNGLISMNPAKIAAGLTVKGLQLYNEYLNNPNTGIRNIFNEFDRAAGSTPPTNAPATATPPPSSASNTNGKPFLGGANSTPQTKLKQ